MAFSPNGVKISYECGDLIDKLQHDIDMLGSDFMVDVTTEECAGALIYKDYIIAGNVVPENMLRMSAMALMTAYEIQDSVL